MTPSTTPIQHHDSEDFPVPSPWEGTVTPHALVTGVGSGGKTVGLIPTPEKVLTLTEPDTLPAEFPEPTGAPAVEAWETENMEIVIWGTHDQAEATVAWQRLMCSPPYEQWELPDFKDATRFWGMPKLRNADNWGDEQISETAVEGWTPHLILWQ